MEVYSRCWYGYWWCLSWDGLEPRGAGVGNSGITVAGGLTGALLYGLLEDQSEKLVTKRSPGPTKHVSSTVL